MKQFNHTYDGTKGLITFINDNGLDRCSLVNIFASEQTLSEIIVEEIQSVTTEVNLTVILSDSITETNVQFTKFPTDVKIIDKTHQKEYDVQELNNLLESKVRDEVEKNRQKDQMMYQQSRFASMGEMIGNIAHQWRQPLNIIALVMQDIYISDQLGNLTSKKIEDSYKKSNNLLQYMSQTIDDFRNFFKQVNDEEAFSLKDAVDSVYGLVSTNLTYNNIECSINVVQDSIVSGVSNEFKQVLINLLNNAQDAIQTNHDSERRIDISVFQKEDKAFVRVNDDGGGMKKDVINKVFDPYFTTKDQAQGTGLGLYMSKQIIENSMCGSLTAKNVGKGAEFTVILPVECAKK